MESRILDVAHATGIKQLGITAIIVSLTAPAGQRITADMWMNDTIGHGHAFLQAAAPPWGRIGICICYEC